MFHNNSNISNLYVTKNENQQRIDNFIISKCQKIQKNTLYKIIRIGKIKVNNKKVQPHYKLKTGDKINIYKFKKKKKKKIIITYQLKKKILSCILYEDKYILILNKPSGISVHSGTGIRQGIIEVLRILKKDCKYLELIHRLDKNTSGVLMLSKNSLCLKNIQQQFYNQTIKKKYIALVHGIVKNKKITCNALIQKKNEVKNNVTGKKSTTIFLVKKKFQNYTLVFIQPKTGRTHQIRIHAKYIGHPILFDNKYGNSKLDYNIDKNYQSKKILLHAFSISFIHPKNKKKYIIYAPLNFRFSKYIK